MVTRGFADKFELDFCRKIESKSTVQDSHATTEGDRPEFRQIQQIQKILERRQVLLMSKADKGRSSSQGAVVARSHCM